jgi:hypothetical protein
MIVIRYHQLVVSVVIQIAYDHLEAFANLKGWVAKKIRLQGKLVDPEDGVNKIGG